MLRTLMHAKIHLATVTQAELKYIGSITIDEDLLNASGIIENEKVLVVNINTGDRFETYVIVGERGSGTICLNGAAARLAQIGDQVIIIAYAHLCGQEIPLLKPKIVFVDDKNKITNITVKEPANTKFFEV